MHETFQALTRLMQSQEQRRFLRLHFPHQDAPAARFAVHQIEAEEGLSRDFSFKVELLSDEPSLSLKEMQGKLLVWVLTAICAGIVSLPHALAEERKYGELEFTRSLYRQTGSLNAVNRLYIEKIEIRSSRILAKAQARRINLALEHLYASLYSEAKDCKDPDSTAPWGYEVLFDQVNYAGDTLSVSLDVSGACSRQPYFAKEVANFSLRTGGALDPRQMLSRHAPVLLGAGARVKAGLLILGQEGVGILKKENKDVLDEQLMESCARFLATAGFRVWVRDGMLVLMPSFQYPYTECRREYFIRPHRKVAP